MAARLPGESWRCGTQPLAQSSRCPRPAHLSREFARPAAATSVSCEEPAEQSSEGRCPARGRAGGHHQPPGQVRGRPVVGEWIGSCLHRFVEQICEQCPELSRCHLDSVIRIPLRKVLEALPLGAEHSPVGTADKCVRDASSAAVRLLGSGNLFRGQDHQGQVVLHSLLPGNRAGNRLCHAGTPRGRAAGSVHGAVILTVPGACLRYRQRPRGLYTT